MNRYGVIVATALSIAAGSILGTSAAEAFGRPPQRKRPPRHAAVRKQAPKAAPRLRIGDEPGPVPRIGDEPGPRQRAANWDFPISCFWSTMARNANPGVYDAFADKASLYWDLECSPGNSDGCRWSYWVYLASGSWSLYDPPDSWLASGCANGSLFFCGVSDVNRGVFFSGVKGTYGPGTYTMYVFVYQSPCGQGGSPYDGDCFTFTVD